MKILFFSVNMEKYTSASYQQDLIDSLKNKAEVLFWGPGFEGYDIKLNIDQIKKKFNASDETPIIVGHSWLSDIPLEDSNKAKYYNWIKEKKINKNSLEYCGKLNFNNHSGIKILLLNKEYISLDQKLVFAKENNFNFVLSSNSNYKNYENRTNIKFLYFPYAISQNFLNKNIPNKKYDFFFSGLIQNPYFFKLNKKTSKRLIIQDKLFHSYFGIPLLRKNHKLKLFWNIYTGIKFKDYILKSIGRYKRLSIEEYIKTLQESRIILNTLSPDNLIGPRFYESMASRSICLAENSDILKTVFQPMEHYVPFDEDEDLLDKINFCLSDSKEISFITNNAYNYVKENHTYDIRAKKILELCH